MPNTQVNKSAEKRVRQDKAKRDKNRVIRGYMRDMMRNIRAKDPESAAADMPHAYSILDKAVKNGIIRKRTGARYKSRLSAHAAGPKKD